MGEQLLPLKGLSMNKLFVPFLPPWVETGLQPAFYDKESGTVLQQTARMYDKVNQLIRNFNDLSKETKETIEEYILKFTELKDFVDDYFDNLDVQDEINNKLDDMAEDGTLEEIVGAYINANVKVIMPKNFISVDAGDVKLIKAYDKSILIDTDYEDTLTDVRNFLERNDIYKLDYVILTHYHSDHVGNFIQLCELGYIDTNTVIYLPAYSTLIADNPTTLQYYTDINTYITAHSLNASIPDEGDTLEIEDFKLTFYNCETSIFEEMSVTEYNDCSTVCLVEYGDEKAIFLGDASDKPFKRFVDNQMFNYKINIYNIEHHGNNIDNQDTVFLEQVTPELCLHQTTSYSISLGRNSRSTGLAYMMGNNVPIYSQYNNNKDVIVAIYKQYYSIEQGKQNHAQSGYEYINEYYVDVTTTNTVQNGTSDYPFKELSQALGKISKAPYCRNNIHVADGNYQFQTKQYVSGADITITGNSSHPENVIIDGELLAYDCRIEVDGLTFKCTENYDGMQLYRSTAVVRSCVITPPTASLRNKYGIVANNSFVTVRDSSISYYSNAFYFIHSILNVISCTISNCTNGIYVNRSLYAVQSVTYNTVTTEVSPTNATLLASPTPSVQIFSGNVATTANNTVTLTKILGAFKRIIINVGLTSDGTWQSILVSCYDNVNFHPSSHDQFTIQTASGSFVLQVTDNFTLTVLSNNGNTQNIRSVIGLYD